MIKLKKIKKKLRYLIILSGYNQSLYNKEI